MYLVSVCFESFVVIEYELSMKNWGKLKNKDTLDSRQWDVGTAKVLIYVTFV